MKENAFFNDLLIANYSFQPHYFKFPFEQFSSKEFLLLENLPRKHRAFEILLDLICAEPTPCFLLSAVIDFIQKLNALKVLQGTLCFSHFELWLNQHAQLSKEHCTLVRGKICGKFLPREEYQYFFPIGMGKKYSGSHFICAHPSPDIDTFVSSFVSWLDAFSAQVSDHLHVWNVPGGSPPKQIQRLFEDFFGKESVAFLSESFHFLAPRALDLMKPLPEGISLTGIPIIFSNATLEEIYQILTTHSTIVVKDENEDPIGVINSNALQSATLGTLSLRDFSNKDEMKYSNRLEIISIIDHHRSHFKTVLPAVCIMGDVQSTNVLISELLFPLCDRYERNEPYFIHPQRLFVDYFLMLVAILDDTDLLNKVTSRDVECVAHLLNRLKALISSSFIPIDLSTLKKDENFAKNSAQFLLKHEELYSIYKSIYALKEQDVEESILACFNQNDRTFFLDTKGVHSKVGQTRLFAKNFSLFSETRDLLIKQWVRLNQHQHEINPECDLFIHMISTIPGAEEMYKGSELDYSHSDELWFWIPETERAFIRLDQFLNGFKNLSELKYNLGLEIVGRDNRKIIEQFQKHLHFPYLTQENSAKDEEFCVISLKIKPGTINSRKASIAPFIPADQA